MPKVHKSMAGLVLVGLALSACNTKKSSKKSPEAIPVQPTPGPYVPEPHSPFDPGLWLTDRLDLSSLTELQGVKATFMESGPGLAQTSVYAVQGSATETMTVSLKRSSDSAGTEPYILDMEGAHWNPLPGPGVPLNYVSSSNILTKDHAFFWGGETDKGCGVIGGQIFDRKAASWSDVKAEDAPSPRLHADTHAVGNRILVFGGLVAQAGECAGHQEPRGLTNGKFYSPSAARWEEEVSIPQELLPQNPDHLSSWVVQNHLVVRLGYSDMTKIVAMNLETAEWKVLLESKDDPLKLQVAKPGKRFFILQYQRSKDQDKPATLKLTRIFGKALERDIVSEAFLPNDFTSIHVKGDQYSVDGRGFQAIGIKPGDSLMDTSIQFAVDTSGLTLQPVPLPVFGTSLVEWVELSKGFVGFASDGRGKLAAVYFDKARWTTRRLDIDIDYNQITVARAHKNKVFITMGLDKARNYVIELPEDKL